MIVNWLSYDPAYTSARGAQDRKLGAHAFEPESGDGAGTFSVCGYAPRSKAGRAAPADARRCVWCARIVSGRSKPPDRWTPQPRGFR